MPGPRPRVLIVITLAETGGAQSYVRDLVPALVERYDVVVAASGPGPLADAVRRAGARFVPLEHVRRAVSPRDLLGLLELVRLMRRERPVLVHANSSKAGVLGRAAAVLARVPIRVFTAHGWAFNAAVGPWSRVYLWADRLMRPLTSMVVCVSESELAAGLAAKTCRADRSIVLRNAVEVEEALVASVTSAGPLRLVSVGRLAPPKDFMTLIHAVARFERGSVRLSVFGDGPDRPALEAELERQQLGEIVELHGDVADVPTRLAQAHAFVLSSRSEGLPISVLEAMAAGLPIVAANVGGIEEVVENGVTGYLFEPGDVTGLEARLAALAGNPSARSALGSAARERAVVEFALPRWREAHLRLYDDLMLSRGLH